MGAGHTHGHGPPAGHAGSRFRRRLAAAWALTLAFFGVELAAGIWSGSLALISDAGHMAADVIALSAALFAFRYAVREDTTGTKTFGNYRAEILASGLTVLVMLGIGAYTAVVALRRIGEGADVASTPMLVVGSIGLVVNVVAIGLLRAGARESLNIKGAYLEVVADAAGSVGVMIAAVLIASTGDAVWDTLVAVAIATFVVVRAVTLGRQVLAVLGQHAPEGMNAHQVEAELRGLDGVRDVHDLHLWTLTSGMHVATAHLVTDDAADHHGVLDAASDLLRERYDLEHATLQVESSDHTHCEEADW
jgi:cobalt-zinc-cadmium efflux system protein